MGGWNKKYMLHLFQDHDMKWITQRDYLHHCLLIFSLTVGPTDPLGPRAPSLPCAPFAPLSPGGPGGPDGPVSPGGPAWPA